MEGLSQCAEKEPRAEEMGMGSFTCANIHQGWCVSFKVSIPLISLPNSQRTALQTPIQVQPLASTTQSPILHTLLSNTENQSLDVQQVNFAGKCLHAIPYNHLINTQCMLCVSDI